MRRLSRDELVERGEARSQSNSKPWIYYGKIKSGTRATKNVTGQYHNIPHMIGDMIARHARNGESFSVYAITRIMRTNMLSRSEDI